MAVDRLESRTSVSSGQLCNVGRIQFNLMTIYLNSALIDYPTDMQDRKLNSYPIYYRLQV